MTLIFGNRQAITTSKRLPKASNSKYTSGDTALALVTPFVSYFCEKCNIFLSFSPVSLCLPVVDSVAGRGETGEIEFLIESYLQHKQTVQFEVQYDFKVVCLLFRENNKQTIKKGLCYRRPNYRHGTIETTTRTRLAIYSGEKG